MRPAYRAVTVLAVAAATLTAGAAASAASAVGQPGKVAQAGKVTLHSTRVIYGPRAMVTGPDGALWYTNSIGNSIGRITTSGHVKSAFHAPSIRRPSGIAAGPDGALWFTNSWTIGRITTTGQVTVYPDPGIDTPATITAGPDGAL